MKVGEKEKNSQREEGRKRRRKRKAERERGREREGEGREKKEAKRKIMRENRFACLMLPCLGGGEELIWYIHEYLSPLGEVMDYRKREPRKMSRLEETHGSSVGSVYKSDIGMSGE